jgi:hypothetical protein
MDEFNNRMDAQRDVLQSVNRQHRFAEQLCGLSRKAIERWVSVNRLDPAGEVGLVLFKISSKLFFLSSKSQEQVTEEYQLLSREVGALKNQLDAALAALTRIHCDSATS